MFDVFCFVFIHGLALIGAVTACRWAEDWAAEHRKSRGLRKTEETET